jgi:signal transduction histidine kinase/CheY-like chemotaxis protein/streptogramin lyase
MLAAVLIAAIAATSAAPLVETPQFQAFGTADGLPSETVYALAQDHEGHLWIGTGDGLARYDGVEFVVYRHRPEAADSLPSNVVQALHVDAGGRVWVGTEGGGLSRLEADGGFRHWRRGDPDGLELDDVWSIASTPDGATWFGGYAGGLYRLDPGTGVLRGYRHDPADPRSLASDHVLALAVDRDGALWIGGGAGVDRYQDGSFVRHPPGAGGPRGGLVFSLTADADGSLWIGSAAGLDHRDGEGRIRAAEQGQHLSEPGVTALLRDRPDSLWLATRSGLHHWQQGSLRHYPTPSPRQAGSGRSSLLDLLRDHEGGLWFASVGGGLLYLPPNWRDFTVLRARRDDPATLSAVTPRGIAEAGDGTLWVVGRDGGLDRVDPRSGRVQRQLEAPQALPDRRLHAVLQGEDGAVWIGHQLGISRYDLDRGTLRHWLAGAGDEAPPPGAVDLLIADGSGGFWLSAYSGGIERRAGDGRVLARHLPGASDGLPSADIEQLALGPDGALWLAGSFGIARRDEAGRIAVVDGSPAQRVHSFDFAGADTLWTHRLGALERHAIDGHRLRLLERVGGGDGLPAVESGGLRIDRSGAVWLTSRRGLLRYRPETGTFRSFGVRDGLGNQEFSDRPALRLADGSLAAGTLDGLVLFDPGALYEPAQPPRLRLHRVSVLRDGQRVEFAPGAAIGLRHDDRELQVVARRVSFTPTATQQLRFRLDGFDDDWIDSGAGGERTFSRLPAGRYLLHIDGGGGEAAASAPLALDLQVDPPGWQTLPARLAQLLGVLLLAALAWRAQRRRVARRHAAELAERQRQWALQALEARSQFLATLGHEIRTPMTGVLGMTELLLRGELDPAQRARAEAIGRSGELMLRLLNDALDLARIEAGRLPLEAAVFDLQACVAELGLQQQALAAARGLRFELELDPAVQRWRRGDRMRLQQVLLNLTGNAIKFTEQGAVTLRLIGRSDAGFELQVADTGPGLDREQCARLFRRFEQGDGARTVRTRGGSGLGLAISRELVIAMGGTIEVDSTPGVGSCFRVRLELPLADPPAAVPTSGNGNPPAGCGRRVLLVEDDATIAEVLQALLAAHGWQAVHVAHGLAALGEAAASAYDAAVLDLDLPGLDGLGLARLLRRQHPALPLLALTARADPRAEPDALAAGFDRFLRKPVDGATLSATLATLVGRGAAATMAVG